MLWPRKLAATGVEAIPGNIILLRPEGTQFDLNYLRTQIRENKIDAVVVSRLIKVENTLPIFRVVPTWFRILITTASMDTTARYTR